MEEKSNTDEADKHGACPPQLVVGKHHDMERETLLEGLRNILDDYRDGSQILREMVQNAEDAGATCFKICYDKRSTDPGNSLDISHYFKGPGLCIYNDAMFKENDWKGIKKIGASWKRKENEKLKIGRFGQGFKSVFHITDHVIVLSGEELLIIDPLKSEHNQKECISVTLKDLAQLDFDRLESTLKVLQNKFNFDVKLFLESEPVYNGTLFWFGFRNQENLLSQMIYTDEKVKMLLQQFGKEMPLIPIFLTYIKLIEICEIDDTSCEVRMIHQVNKTSKDETEINYVLKEFEQAKRLPDKTVRAISRITISNKGMEFPEIKKEWTVASCIFGHNDLSDKMKILSNMETSSFTPITSIAYDAEAPVDTQGHVFCFLPLPLSQKSLTGLPVHVNGFFSLEHNRCYVKYKSDQDQSSNALEWNLRLIDELFPKNFYFLLDHLRQDCINQKNNPDTVENFYNVIPDPKSVDVNWHPMLKELFACLFREPVFYTDQNGGQWVNIKDAAFEVYGDTSPDDKMRTVLKNLLLKCGENFTKLPYHFKNIFDFMIQPVEPITSQSIKQVIRQNECWKQFSEEDKLILLEYVLLDGNLDDFHGLELLPLSDGSFETFNDEEDVDSIYLLLNDEDLKIFPTMESTFVSRRSLSETAWSNIQRMADEGLYQLKILDNDDIPSLLQRIFKDNCDVTDGRYVPHKGVLCSTSWIENVWKFILARQFEDLSPFSDIPVVPMISPCQSQGSKNVNFYIWLEGNYMFSSFGSLRPISEPLKRILETSGLFLIDPESTVSILHNEVLDLYVKLPTPENVMRWFEALTDKTATAKRINTGCSDEDRCSFAQYLVEHTCNLTFDSINFFKLLQIFTQTDNTHSRGVVSFTENSNLLTIPEFPRSLHFPILLLEDKYRELFHSLGGKDQEENWFYNIILEHMLQDDSMYCEADKITFMKFLMKRKELDDKVLAKAKCLRFIPTETGRYCTVKQLFDPTSHLLQNLFIGENDRFPGMKLAFENELITFLKDLGLNTERDLTSSTIVEVVKRLTKPGLTEKQKLTKAATILKLLLEDTPIISDDGLLEIKDVEWVPCLKTKPTGYHSSLQFYGERTTKSLFRPMEIKDIHFSNLVGSVVPLVANISKGSRIAKVYKWFEGPSVTFVIEHFKNVIDIYSESDNLRFVSLARDIFQYLNQCYKDDANARGIMIQQLHEMRCIPTSQYGFQKANQTVFLTENSVPLQLEPYIYTLPDEFKSFQDLFIDIGVRETVSFEILESVLTMINEKYKGEQRNTNEKGKDLKLAVDILKIVAQMDVSREKLQRLYVPIRTKDESLMFDQVSRCTFAEKTHISDLESDIIFSHHDIHGIARKLGIATITTRTLKMNSVFIPWGQDNPLTTAIAEHLEDYADGFSIPKELFQNADDAGATKIAFIYDERQNYESRKGLFDDGMSECHGPALWVYNDSIFLEKDFENILKLGGKTKQHERDKIGKFGLGFCSVYNLTDVPSLISGNTIVVLDPHLNHLGEAIQEGNPGVRVTITKDILTIYRNQLKPYEGVLGINFDEVLSGQKEFDYKGTIFRLPLRTHHQAANSKIKDTEYRKEEMTLLIDKLLRDASNLLLFSQSVHEINVFHLDGQSTMPEKDMRLMFTAVKTPKDTCSLSFLNRVIRSENQSPLAEVQLIDIRVEKTESACRFLKDSTAFCNEQSFLLSWNTGSKSFHLAEKLKKLRAIPVGSVAIPVRRNDDKIQSLVNVSDVPEGFYQKSHVFCFLPLPTPIQLPVHINGCFMVGKDRKNVLTHNEDNINQDSSEWNNAVLTDIVQTAYVEMFTHVNFNLSISCANDGCYWMMWPFLGENPDVNKLVRSFYHNIVHQEPPVFYRVNQQTNELVHTSFKKAIFLHPSFRSQSGRGDIAFDCLTNFYVSDDIKVMDMPREIYDVITSPEFNSSDFEERFISKFDFFRLYFLPFLKHDYWRTDEKRKDRCELIKEGLEDENLHKLMKEFECIPVKGSDLLRRPCDLVYEQGSVSKMFDIDDYRFPIEDLGSYVDTLLHLEMMNSTLSSDELMNRAKSMQSLSTNDVGKAIQRYKAILRYLYNRFEEHNDLGNLKAISFIPVMQKPADWPDMIPWKGDDVQELLKAPMDLISPQHVDLSGAVSLIAMPSDHTDPRILKLIGIGEVNTDIVIEQLIHMSKSTNAESTRFRDMIKNVYRYLNSVLEQEFDDVTTKSLNILRENAVVYVSGIMVRPENVAMSIDGDCSPYLYQIDNSMTEFDQLWLLLKIQNHFNILELIHVLKQIKCDVELKPLGAEGLGCTVNILKNICKQCKQESRNPTPDEKKGIFIPDKDGILRHINEICFDDGYKGIVVTKDDFHYVHENVTLEFGLIETLQIQSKRQLHVSKFGKSFSQFGQKEKLVNRLKGIISEYPKDHSIMNELLQNADDAGATKIHFVYDMRKHGTQKTFSEAWSQFQGSALVVFNDASFTDNDLQKIQDLGEGSKQNDPMKTGQFGIGFNAVYHLTDLPSFITKGPNRETFCVMDPHNTIGGDSTGFEFNNLEELKTCYPDVYNAHLQLELKSEYGTWFRFPIRTKDQAEKSEISKTFLDENAITAMMKTMKNNMAKSMLFLSNVEKMFVSFIKPDSKSFTFSVSLEMSEENRRRKIGFKEKAKQKMTEVKNRSKSIRELGFHESVYEICINIDNKHSDRWLVVEAFGFQESEKVSQNVQNVKLAPIGGVAKHLQRLSIDKGHVEWCGNENEGGISCFLPLPISTGLPVHINGHFVLSHNRAQIFGEDFTDDIRFVWNELIITETIANAYSSLIQAFKDNVTDDKSLRKFFYCFPHTSLANANLWKDLSYATYRILLTRSVFPVCPAYMKHDCKEHTSEEKSQHNKEFRIREWVTMKTDKGKFPALFDDLKSLFKGNKTHEYQTDTRGCTFYEEHELRKVLIDIGMKLICCPNFIFESIQSSCHHKIHRYYRAKSTPQKAGKTSFEKKQDEDVVEPPVGCICQRSIKPCEVIAFLKLWKESNSRECTSMADSEIKTIDRLLHLLNFCMRECVDDISPIIGLPLLCTENLIFREFKQQSDLIMTEYSDILSGSPECFVHRDLIRSLRKFEKHFRVLDIDVFTSLLPKTLSRSKYLANGPIDLSVQLHYIERVWQYINSQESLSEELKRWCIVPCKWDGKDMLVSMQQAYSLFVPIQDEFKSDNDSYRNDYLSKLSLPSPNIEIMEEEYVYDIVSSIRRPEKLIKCLHFHKDAIDWNKLEQSECSDLLKMFAEAVKSYDYNDLQLLKCLPIFTTVTGQLVAIDGNQQVLVVKTSDCPVVQDGIDDICSVLRTVLLEYKESHEPLFSKLGCIPCYEPINKEKKSYRNPLASLYTKLILPNFNLLKQEHHLSHLEFIRDELCQVQEVQIHLKDLKFIPDEKGRFRSANAYFSPRIELFAELCMPDEIPPEPFSTQEWDHFMELAGIETEITEEKILKFATDIQRAGVNEKSTKQSKLLLESLFNMPKLKSRSAFLQRISQINFIPTGLIDMPFLEICDTFSPNGLVSFQSAEHPDNLALCWSVTAILPKYAIPDDEDVQKMLKISTSPALQSVISHIHKVCEALSNKIMKEDNEQDNEDLKFVENLMREFYAFLDTMKADRMFCSEAKVRFSQTSLIFNVERKRFNRPSCVVLKLPRELEIPSYLSSCSECFGAYFELFRILGASDGLSLSHYCQIMKNLKVSAKDEKLTLSELHSFKMAFRGLLQYLQNSKDEIVDNAPVEDLYLLNDRNIMKHARDLVVSDDFYYKARLTDVNEIDFLCDLSQLMMEFNNIYKILLRLPKVNRPSLLSQCTTEDVLLKESAVPCDLASLIESYLTGNNCRYTMIRLLKTYQKTHSKKIDDTKYKDILERLSRIRVIALPNLETILFYRKQEMRTSVRKRNVFFVKEENAFYMQFTKTNEQNEWMRNNAFWFAIGIKTLAGYQIWTDIFSVVFPVFGQPNEEVVAILNGYNVADADYEYKEVSWFPLPGTLVRNEDLHMLRADFEEFSPGEHAVFEIYGDDRDDDEGDNSIYIYVKVRKKLTAGGSFTIYSVNTGEEPEEKVPSFRLYKLMRKDEDTQDLEYFTDGQASSDVGRFTKVFQTVEALLVDAWREGAFVFKRVVRRLMLRWHPDKNDNSEFCGAVFKHLTSFIKRLQNGEIDVRKINAHREHGEDVWNDCMQRATGRADVMEGYQFDVEECFPNVARSTKKRSTSYTTSVMPNPQPHMGRVWMRQAKFDLEAARSFLEIATDHTFNWVCVQSHQAAEKALKAVLVSEDVSQVGNDHFLPVSVARRNPSLHRTVQELEALVVNYSRMRYPRVTSYPLAPSELYKKVQAERSVELATEIIECVDETFM